MAYYRQSIFPFRRPYYPVLLEQARLYLSLLIELSRIRRSSGGSLLLAVCQ
jgi:hypothetical protein